MTPLQINILLHYHVTVANDYAQWAFRWNEDHARSQAVRDAVVGFALDGLLQLDGNVDVEYAAFEAGTAHGLHGRKPWFSITDKGRAMVEHLCAVKIPVCKWVQPEGEVS